MQTIADCPVCGYPIKARPGQSVSCANCGGTAVAAPISDVTIPTTMVVMIVAFGMGWFFGNSVSIGAKRVKRGVESKARGN